MAQQIHYEIFRRHGAKGGWSLHEVRSDREVALQLAQGLMAEGNATGVKVVKETYNDETGDFLTLKIFEDGHNQVKVAAAAEDAPHALPCFRPDDLYSYHARQTIMRLLADFLARNRLTVTELIHRADMLEKLEATGTLYQHAIQKIAVAQAASTTTPVAQIMKSLNELATSALHRVYRDQRKGLFPDPKPEQFGILADKLAPQSDGAYVLNGAIARHLKDAKGWDEKVFRLLTVMEHAPAEGPGRMLMLSSVDAIIAEILSGSAALHELMGQTENLAASLGQLVELFLGKPREAAAAASGSPASGLALLTHHFAADDLPEARTAIAGRIIAEVKSAKRLCPNSLVDELKALRFIANRLVLGIGKYMAHEDLIAAFTLRSKRITTHEALGTYLADAAPDVKLERLLFVEENIIGAENKRQLATFVMPVLNSPAFENHFHNAKVAPLQRLQRLAGLQAHVRRSGFQEAQRAEIANFLDKLATEIEARAKIFDSIEAKTANHVEKALTLLRLATGGFLTEGALAGEARNRILGHLGRPGFLAGYLAQLNDEAEKKDSEKAMAGLLQNLGRAGITAETGLKSIAA